MDVSKIKQEPMSDTPDPSESESEMTSTNFVDNSVEESVGEQFYFESDHEALKNNADYQKVLKTVITLQAQTTQAVKDLEKIHEQWDKALADPIGFVQKLQQGTLKLDLPKPQKLAQLPTIDWSKYTDGVDFSSFANRQSARLKRHVNDNADDENLQHLKSTLGIGKNAEDGLKLKSELYVRGRYKDESKSATFNKLWTEGEQKLLDELLVKYPPEEVEARRWRKIAAAFPDRTPQQIASRVQKYFEKLEKAQLPVPGRVPNRVSRNKKATHRHHRHSLRYHESTFLQMYKPPVMMKEEDEDELTGSGWNHPAPEHDIPDAKQIKLEPIDDDEIPLELRDTPEYKEFQRLMELRRKKLKTLDPSIPQHINFKCNGCKCQPIVGMRYHCVDCPKSTSVDFCHICAHDQGWIDIPNHNSSHRLRAVKRTWNQSRRDEDYLAFDNDNYLDPNFMPPQ